MTSIILIRYHNHFDLVKHRIKMYQYLNPDMEVHGLYGGPRNEYDTAQKILGKHFISNYYVPNEDTRWKWAHADITYQYWFRDIGHQLTFDRVYVIEYDLLLLKPLNKLYKHVGINEIGCTGLIPLEKVEKYWYWTANEERRKLYENFKNSLQKIFPNKAFKEYAMLGPGICLSRLFLERLESIKMVDGNFTDELKLHLWAQMLGINVKDNKLVRKWISPKEYKFFNSSAVQIKFETIQRELRKPWGRRAFHPYFNTFEIGQ